MLTPATNAEERIKVYPKNVSCGEKVNIGLTNLIMGEMYKITLECGSLNCSADFVTRDYEISKKNYALIQEEFDIAPGCIEEFDQSTPSADLSENQMGLITKTQAPEGKYNAKLFNTSKNELVAFDSFNLVSNLSKTCALKTREVAKISKLHKFELNTSQACTYNVTLVDPTGVRTAIISQFVSGASPLEHFVKPELLNKNGTYKLTAVATPQCSPELDRECKYTEFTISDSTNNNGGDCVYMGAPSESNCLQCSEGFICKSSNKCAADSLGVCNKKQSNESTQAVSKVDSRNLLNLIEQQKGLVFIGTGVFMGCLIMFGVILLFMRNRYRIKE